jgi:hypothetical protein
MFLTCPHCKKEITKNKPPKVICPYCKKDTKTPPNGLSRVETFLDEAQSWKSVGWFVKCFRFFGWKGLCGFILATLLILNSTYWGEAPESWVKFFTSKYGLKELKTGPKPKHINLENVDIQEFRDKYEFLRVYQKKLQDEAKRDKQKKNIFNFKSCYCISEEFLNPTKGFNWRIEATADYFIHVEALSVRSDRYVKRLEVIECKPNIYEFKVPNIQKGERLAAVFTIDGGAIKSVKGKCEKLYIQSVE